MKIIIMALGTRGDVEPLLAIGSILKSRGHDVICGMSAQFREMVEDTRLRFSPFSKKYLEIIESETGSNFMGQKGSFLKKVRMLIEMYRQIKPIQRELVTQQRQLVINENPDRIIYSMKCLYPVIWGMSNPNRSFMILPIPGTLHKVTSYSPVLPNSKYGYRFNKIIYWLVQNAFSKQIRDYTKDYHSDFPQLKFTKNSIKEFIMNGENILYAISPSIFKRPDFWPEKARIVGYHERSRTTNWEPEEDLLKFIKKNKQILFFTFGSMLNTEPEKKTGAILEILEKHRIAAIINTSSGGLVKPDKYPDHVYFTSTIPYEWIFPKVYAVIHHGGSGTTHTALKYGCASLVVPHILDQFFWAYVINEKGVGPKGIPIKKLNKVTLEPALLDLIRKKEYKMNSERIAEQMKREEFVDDLIEVIE
jgi:sterol 3beta-glucosyltransferase